MSTDAQIRANRANAQLSTGPSSSEGKAKCSLNAVQTGLTGRTVLLPDEDAAAYEAHVASFFKTHQPSGDEERRLVQSLADTEWRLLRIPALEMGIYALGHLEFADQFPNDKPELRKHLIDAKILLVYQRQLNNLSIQENRLRRHREKDLGALREFQESRRRLQKTRLNEAAKSYIRAVHEDRHEAWEPAPNGFEFSIDAIELRALEIEPDLFLEWAKQNIAEEKAG